MITKEPFSEHEQVSIGVNKVASKQVFIIGSRRSGTTWTLWLLSNHPSMVGVQHTNIIESLKKLESWWQDEDPYRNSIVSGKRKKNTSTLKDHLSEDEFYTLCRDMISKIFTKAFNEKVDATIIVESQPENIDFLDYLGRIYPDAYFLHVIRDPRSVYSSWKSIARTWSSPDIFETHPAGFSERWLKDIKAGRKKSGKTGKYMEIHYEAMQNDGTKTLQDIYTWLDIDSNNEIAETSLEECKITKLREKANMPKGFFRKGLNDGWKSELSGTEIRCIEYLLSDIMDELGYERINKGKIPAPFKLQVYRAKRKFPVWLKQTYAYDLLRKAKRLLKA